MSVQQEENTALLNYESVINQLQHTQSFHKGEDIQTIDNTGLRELSMKDISFYRIKQLSFDSEYPRREAFENVLLSMDNTAYNFVYILTSSQNGIEIDIGVVKNKKESSGTLSANNYGAMIEQLFSGNFNGSDLERLRADKLKETLFESNRKYKVAGAVVGIPSETKDENSTQEGIDFQGVDRLVNSMLGRSWRIVVVCEPVGREEVDGLMDQIYGLYNQLSIISKQSVQLSQNEGESYQYTVTTSHTRGKNDGWSEGRTHGDSHGYTPSGGGKTSNHESSSSQTKSGGTSEQWQDGDSKGATKNQGKSGSVTFERVDKQDQEMLRYIDEELLERMKLGKSKGLFKTSVYYMAENPAASSSLQNGITAMFQGNKSSISPLVAKEFKLEENTLQQILCSYQSIYEPIEKNLAAYALLGRVQKPNALGVCTYLTSKEISLLAGMPLTEIPGITVKEGVNFGLNQKDMDILPENEKIELGCMVHKNRKLESLPFYLKRKSLTKHTFIAGVTGGGKTTTCHRLLSEAKGTPFLVIEPAKTEYRTLIQNELFQDVMVFTIGNETVAPFRLNPFELIPGELLTSHVDMLKATFTSAFPMEGSMPQMLEEAIYACYEKKGWNIDDNTNEFFPDPFDEDADSMPTLQELLDIMESIVDEKGFGDRLGSEYKGSLISRLSNLTKGSKGQMLNCKRSINFEFIAEHNVVLELEELRSPEDKALMMGFILSRLAAVIRKKHKADNEYRHLTLVEEAHRLLEKTDYADSGAKKASVETFADLLAEVRKYGEGLIIVDQIPNKLAPEVLKNTNTKIIHKLFAKDDKEAVGNAMMMDDKQKEYLSSLGPGHAIVFTENTETPVHVLVNNISDTDEKEVNEEVVANKFNEVRQKYRKEMGNCYEALDFKEMQRNFDECLKLFGEDLSGTKGEERVKEGIRLGKVLWEQMTQEIRHRKELDNPALTSSLAWSLTNGVNQKETEEETKERQQIFRKLVEANCRRSGKGMNTDSVLLEEHQTLLWDFFSEKIAKDDVTIEKVTSLFEKGVFIHKKTKR